MVGQQELHKLYAVSKYVSRLFTQQGKGGVLQRKPQFYPVIFGLIWLYLEILQIVHRFHFGEALNGNFDIADIELWNEVVVIANFVELVELSVVQVSPDVDDLVHIPVV